MSGIIGLISVSAASPGAGEVQTFMGEHAGTARDTLITPTSGKKMRVISYACSNPTSTGSLVHCYFGTGAAITTNPGSAVHSGYVEQDVGYPVDTRTWPDGGGPVGAVDEILSVLIAVGGVGIRFTITFREE